jgi:hypothetical protein
MEQDNADVAVVKIDYKEEEAHRMGYAEFKGHDTATDPEVDPYFITDSARWANVIQPQLRAMAGFDDSGVGTYTISRDVAAINPGTEEDEPSTAQLMAAQRVLELLNKAYFDGAHDALSGE